MAEGGYEGVEFGREQCAYEIRKQAYWTQLGGGYHLYGHNDAWMAPHNWQTWLDSPGSQNLQHFREIITAIDRWWTLVPDANLIVAGAGQGVSLNVAARLADDQRIVCYISTPSKVTIRLPEDIAFEPYSVQMVQPSTGIWFPSQEFAANREHTFETPSGWQDALVVITSHA